MRCPKCQSQQDSVTDSRELHGGRKVRRRRACSNCGARWTTYEQIPPEPILRDSMALMAIRTARDRLDGLVAHADEIRVALAQAKLAVAGRERIRGRITKAVAAAEERVEP